MDVTPPREPAQALRLLDTMRPREPGRVTVQIAKSAALMDLVYRLRHDSYVAQGFLEPQDSGKFGDEWDEMENFFSVLCFYDGMPAASVRISHCKPLAPEQERTLTTAMDGWEDEIYGLARSFRVGDQPTVLMEMSRLTRHPNFPESNSDPIFGIFRANFYCLIMTNADILLSTVRQHHMPFYRRLGFQKITDPRKYPKLAFEVGLMACFRQSFKSIQASIPIFQGIDRRDSVYERFFAGEPVAIFDEMPIRVPRR
jgi:hypothetical protein